MEAFLDVEKAFDRVWFPGRSFKINQPTPVSQDITLCSIFYTVYKVDIATHPNTITITCAQLYFKKSHKSRLSFAVNLRFLHLYSNNLC